MNDTEIAAAQQQLARLEAYANNTTALGSRPLRQLLVLGIFSLA